jgi:hypothetical protein
VAIPSEEEIRMTTTVVATPTTLTDTSPDRWLALGGPAYAALLAIAAIAFPSAPDGEVAAALHPVWLAQHTSAMVAQGLLRAVASLGFVVLTVALATACHRVRVRGAWPTLALVGGALTGLLMLAAQATAIAAALLVRSTGHTDSALALGHLQAAFLDMSSLPATLLFLGVGVVAGRRGFLPRWLALATLVGVPLALLDSASYDGGPLEPVAEVGLAYFLLWSLVVGIGLLRNQPAEG